MKPWVPAWESVLGLPAGLPEPFVALLALTAIFFGMVLPMSAFMAFVERKLRADFQARVGPNRAGPAGFFQPLADSLKLLQKETAKGGGLGKNFWLVVSTSVLYSTVAFLPVGSATLLIDTDLSAILPFWAVLVLAFTTMLLGFNQGSISGWLGGIRIASQMLSGALPGLIALMTAVVHVGSFQWSRLAEIQGASPWAWTAFQSPFQCLAFLIFVVSGLVLLGASPLDGGTSLPDSQGGVAAHLSGRRLLLFKLGRFYGSFLWMTLTVVVFLGAWEIPVFLKQSLLETDAIRLIQVLEALVLLTKTGVLMLVLVWVSTVTPRLRVDQVTNLAWKVLSPIALATLVGAALWAGGVG